MRRVLLLLFLFVLSAMGLFTGVLLKPFLGVLEWAVDKYTPYTATAERARLSLSGDVVITQIVLRKEGHPLSTLPEVVLDPRWSALFRRKIVFDSIALVWGDGFLTATGTVEWRRPSIILEGTNTHFPLDRLIRGFADIPAGLHAAHTGNWRFSWNLQQWEFNIDGTLDQSPEDPVRTWHGLPAHVILHGQDARATKSRFHQSGETPQKENSPYRRIWDQRVSVAKSNSSVSCQVRFVGHQGKIDLRLAHEQSEGSASVTLDTEKEWLEGDFKVNATPLSSFDALWPALSQTRGSLAATGHLAGPWTEPDGTVRLEGEGVSYKGSGVKTLLATFERKTGGAQPLSLKVLGSSITWVTEAGTPRSLSCAEVSWEGTQERGSLQWTVRWANGTTLKGRGPAHRKGFWMAWSWDALRLLFPQGEEFSAVRGGSVELTTSGEIDVKNLQVGEGDQGFHLRRFTFMKGVLALDASARHFYFKIPQTLLAGHLNGEVFLKGPLNRPEGHFDFQISSGSYGNSSGLSGWAKGKVENGVVSLSEAEVGTEALPPVRLHGNLPWAWVVLKETDQPMDIIFETGRVDPAVLVEMNPEMKVEPGGFLQVNGHVFGPKGAIVGEGRLTGYLPLFEMPCYGISARDTNVDIELKDRRLNIRNAETKWGKGNLRISGGGDLPALNLELQGTKISLAIRRRLGLLADLHLQLRGTLAAPALTGDIALSQGTYESAKKKKTEEPPKEVNPTLRRIWDSLRVDLVAVWPNNVWYRDGLTKIDTRADLNIIKLSGDSVPGLRGSVTVLKGNYDAYGRDFIIKTGELTFMDPSEMDPQLNGQATHKMKDYLVELSVSGTARKPELHFQSTPPLPEQDILALLALGKVPGQSASQGAGQEDTSSQAADLAADVVSNYLTREMRSAGMNVLDLDVIRVSPSQKGSEWTVGRYWGSKLFLSYSYNPEDAANQVLKAEYSLTPRWTFVGQTGSQSDNYLDLSFRLPVGKSRKAQKKEK